MTSRAADAGRDAHREAGSGAWWLHPFLVAAFPVLFLFSQNIGEQLSLDPLWQPLLTVLGIAAAALLLAVALARVLGFAAARAALVVSLLLAIGLTYGHAWNLVGEALGLHRYLLLICGALIVAGSAAALLLPARVIGALTAGITALAAILIVLNLVPAAGLGMRTLGAEIVPPAEAGPGTSGSSGEGRDVWYVVLDRYAGSPSLKRIYGYDNAPFLDDLAARGFVVAEGATANYLKTAHSLASSLNMAELDGAALAAESTSGSDFTPLYRMLQRSHALERFLHEREYRYIHLGLRRGATYTNAEADSVLLLGTTTEFSAVLADTTILAALASFAPAATIPGTAELYAGQTLFQLEELERLADVPGRNFVFAHILLPHPPYFFNADGSRVTPEQAASRSPHEQYLEQLRFANARIGGLLDRLLDGPPASWPIVVLAADEGPFPATVPDDPDVDWTAATDDELLEKFSILAAVLVPGVDRAGLEAAGFSDTISAVNLLAAVLNAGFDADLPLIDDRNWIFPDQRHLYEFIDRTDRVRAAIDAARSAP